MPQRYRLPPTVSALRKFDVNRRGEVEAVRQSLYDFQTYASAGQTELIFFQVPQGQGGKTIDDTNMEIAGSLPRPKEQLVESIEVYFYPGVDIGQFGTQAESEWSNDVQAVAESGNLDFFIGSKSYLTEAPIGRFPPKVRLYAESAYADGGANAVTNQQIRYDYSAMAGRPYFMDPEIRLIHTQNFAVRLRWNTAVALPSGQDARIGVVLDGVLYRLSQ